MKPPEPSQNHPNPARNDPNSSQSKHIIVKKNIKKLETTNG